MTLRNKSYFYHGPKNFHFDSSPKELFSLLFNLFNYLITFFLSSIVNCINIKRNLNAFIYINAYQIFLFHEVFLFYVFFQETLLIGKCSDFLSFSHSLILQSRLNMIKSIQIFYQKYFRFSSFFYFVSVFKFNENLVNWKCEVKQKVDVEFQEVFFVFFFKFSIFFFQINKSLREI